MGIKSYLKRTYPIGAEIVEGKGVHFRVWAPNHKKVRVVFEKNDNILDEKVLEKEKLGYFSLFVPNIEAGALYRYYLGNSSTGVSDPASRFQPFGVDGPSLVVDSHFKWSKQDKEWPGVIAKGHIIYEMHIGTFTQEGTYNSAKLELKELAKIGITLIELMPLNQFPGNFGWGYDGVNLFAPYQNYGTPAELKSFIDECHKLGMGVILDVVYNHFGPDGNVMNLFSEEFTHSKEKTEWGTAINFDHPSTREFFVTNAKYWIEEFHFDGLRIDAAFAFFSESKEHILAALTKAVKSSNPNKNKIVIGEDESQNNTLLKPYNESGYGFDAVWNDDFHHSALVRLKGKREAYYVDYSGSCQEFISSFKYGYLYQGQYYYWQKKERGTSTLDCPPQCFIIFTENHDQIANSGTGKRIHQLSDPGNYRAMTALLLLGPNTPLIFQGQEFGSSSPFHYFADHKDTVNQLILAGRKESLARFQSIEKNIDKIIDPSNPMTFTQCKLDFTERKKNKAHYKFYRDLISLRKKDSVFQNVQMIKMDGAILGPDIFVLRFFGKDKGDDRLIIVNFGIDQTLVPVSEPLLAAGDNLKWEILFSSSALEYGGEGTAPLTVTWNIQGHTAIVLGTKARKSKQFFE